MNINFLKNLPAVAVCFASFSAFAGMDMDSRVSQLEAQMKQVRTATENKNFGAKTATAGAMLDDPYHVTLGIGAVYQSAILGSTEFAYTENDTAVSYPVEGDLKEAKDNWSWGINAFVGYNFDHDGYDMKITNSYFDTSASSTANAGFGGAVVPLRASTYIVDETSETSFTNCSESKSQLSITYDLLGLELGRDFYVSQYLAIRPFIGLLSSWMWLENNISYSGGEELTVNSVYVEDHSNWWGIGPQFGLNSEYGLGGGFSIFADTKGALTYGRFRVYHTEDFSGTANPEAEVKAYGHRIVPYVQAVLGVSYEFTTDNNKNHFLLRAGYNTQYFFGANQMLRPSNNGAINYITRQNNNLQTQGLILDASWAF